MKKALFFVCLITSVMAAHSQALLNRAVVDGRVDSVRMGINLPHEFTGQGVIIGVTDWGFDYTHPVFYDTNMIHYRVLRAWDQFKTSGPAPDGYDYGTEYVGAEALLSARCDTSNVYDYAYHGTHCASIAGGGGAGTSYRGVAVDAEFLFVSVSLTDQQVIDAWNWMYNIAQQEGKRLVISSSWGLYYLDNMDGTGPLAEEMQRLNDLGVVFTVSGGNNGEDNFHIQHSFTQEDTIRTQFLFPSSSIGSNITMMNSENEPFSFQLFLMNNSYEIVAETPFFPTANDGVTDTFLIVGTDTIHYMCDIQSSNAYNHKPVVQLRVYKNTAYKFGIAVAADGGDFHAWNLAQIETNYGNWGASFIRPSQHPDWLVGNAYYGISTPGNIDCAITVAAHQPRYTAPSGSSIGGSIASFSSYGPGFHSTLKPDISAPGKSIVSAISSYTNSFTGNYTTSVNFNDRTYRFAALSGTSMSNPFVAGVSALVLQANPYLSAAQVKDILIETAYNDQYTEISGEVRFGNGKVNAYQAILKALTTVGVESFATPNESLFTVYPNPVVGECFVTANTETAESLCQIIDLSGRTVFQAILTPGVNSLNLHSLTPGYYLLKITDAKTVVTKKIAVFH